ncbi:hypothetical protein Q8F55_005985 [Vanrija albida]|uniref:Uncharacterized protein n=1 Tax=Vanrija albida TaxID=181172 RepID=A0ABR3Q3X4_9TREE
MSTRLGSQALFSPHSADITPGADKLRRRTFQYLAYRHVPTSTWLASVVVPNASFWSSESSRWMWCIADSVTGARVMRPDDEVAAVPGDVFRRMQAGERDVYRPAYKFKLAELSKRRQEIWAWKLRWNDPPPTAEMRRVAHEFANTRVRVAERLPAHEAVLAGGKLVVPPSAPSLHEHRECDASFVAEVRRSSSASERLAAPARALRTSAEYARRRSASAEPYATR